MPQQQHRLARRRNNNVETPLVSVVIPVYNTERYVAATLESVLAQSYRNLEIIVVIDGSTDSSHDTCRTFEDPRIRYVVQENQGLAAARNSGIRESRGKHIAFLDSDDTWYPEKVARHVESLENDPDLGLSYSYSALIDSTGEKFGNYQKSGTDPTSFYDCYVKNTIGNGSNAVLRREVFSGRPDDPGAFPPLDGFVRSLRRAEDYELWSRICATTRWRIACVPEPLVNYRVNPEGLSANVKAQQAYHFLAMAMVAELTPDAAEHLRRRAVAHVYWHQARILAGGKQALPARHAVRKALQYEWRTLDGNHLMICLAVTASLVLPRQLYYGLYRSAGRMLGRFQKLSMKLAGGTISGQQRGGKQRPAAELVRKPRVYVRRRAMPNLFFLCHKHRFMYLAISKNASSSMKQLMYKEETGKNWEKPSHPQQSVHRYWGWKPSPGMAVNHKDLEGLSEYPDYLKFTVYRDPVSRFLSCYHNKVLYGDARHPFYSGKRLEGMGLDQFIRVAESVLKIGNPLHIDEHLRPQAWCYDAEDVDFIVPIEHLDDFLQAKFGLARPARFNRTTLPRLQATEEQQHRVRELYRCDYGIVPNWSPQAPGDDETE